MANLDTTLVANTIQPLYEKKLLDHGIPLVMLAQYATKGSLPAKGGATSIRFFRPPQADVTAAIPTLTEGTPPSADSPLSLTNIDVPLAQIGRFQNITDIADNVGLINYLKAVTEFYGEQFAVDVDNIIRNVLSSASTGLTKRYAQGLANWAGLAAASTTNGAIIPRDILDAVTRLQINLAPTIKGKYVIIIPPQVSRDIVNSAAWSGLIQYQAVEKIFTGQIGELYGARLSVANNPFLEATGGAEGTYAANGGILASYVLGGGAFGTVDLPALGASVAKPRLIINDKPDKSDPLNQKLQVGWKGFMAAKVLNTSWGIALRGQTLFTG